jgi:hypothetical protein
MRVRTVVRNSCGSTRTVFGAISSVVVYSPAVMQGWHVGNRRQQVQSIPKVERIDGSDPKSFWLSFEIPEATGPGQPPMHTTEPLAKWELRELLNEMGVDPVDVDRDIRRARQPAV